MVIADKFSIDGHKLMYHIPRVYRWLQDKNIYPIYAEIGLSGGCNQRCIFCALDYLKYQPDTLDYLLLKKFITEAAKRGIKSIMYAGEGEPLLHPKIADIIRVTKKNGIDVAVTSNAVMFSGNLAKKCLPYLSWFRASINAGTPVSYSKIHRAGKQDFHIVLKNLERAVKIKNKKKYHCTIGAQFLLIPQNLSEALILARQIERIGLDYLIIKPYSHHPASSNKIKAAFKYEDTFHLEKELAKYSDDRFRIIFRRQAMEKMEQPIPYKYCLGSNFATFITAKGEVYPCNRFFGNKDFVFGNIYNDSFRDIWLGNRRKRIAGFMRRKLTTEVCRKICRLDEINRYLWELKNPAEHVNFI
jgi:radical SAM protein with 4Fe4S-binding SPASM domain